MLPGLQATVGDFIDHGVTVRWKCEECRASGLADLHAIATAKGRAYCLTDKTAACRTPGCSHWVTFYGQAGMRNWPLRTEGGLIRQMDRRSAWLTEQWKAKSVP